MKYPPCAFAQRMNSGGSSHSGRRRSRIQSVIARNTYVTRYGRSAAVVRAIMPAAIAAATER